MRSPRCQKLIKACPRQFETAAGATLVGMKGTSIWLYLGFQCEMHACIVKYWEESVMSCRSKVKQCFRESRNMGRHPTFTRAHAIAIPCPLGMSCNGKKVNLMC